MMKKCLLIVLSTLAVIGIFYISFNNEPINTDTIEEEIIDEVIIEETRESIAEVCRLSFVST